MVCLIFLASVKIKFPEAETAAISSHIGKVLTGSVGLNGNRIRQKRKREDLAEEKITEYGDDTDVCKINVNEFYIWNNMVLYFKLSLHFSICINNCQYQ